MKKAVLTFLLSAPFVAFGQSKPSPAALLLLSKTRGEVVYKQYCLTCHQADGGGVPNMNPPLTKTSYINGDRTRLIKVVLEGFPTPVDIDGESYSNNMPPHNFLKDQEIADVLTFVRNSFGNKGSIISLASVKLVRAGKKLSK